MKVCMVCYQYAEKNLRLQPWRYFSEVAAGLARNGIEVKIITDHPCGHNEMPARGIQVASVRKIRTWLFPNRELLSVLERECPDVILWHSGPLDLINLSVLKKLRAPVIAMVMGPLYRLSYLAGLKLPIRDLVANPRFFAELMLYSALTPHYPRFYVNSALVKKTIVISGHNKAELISMGALPDKIVHIPAGIGDEDLKRPDDCETVVEKFGVDPGRFNVLYLGSPSTIRGVDTAIIAMSRLREKYPDVNLIILSRRKEAELTAEETYVSRLIKSGNLDSNVQLISGFLSRDDVKRFLGFCDIVALPFKIVPADSPLSILESMAMATPVISTDIDGIPELLRDGRGLVVRPGSPEELAEQIGRCVENCHLLQDMGARSLAYMKAHPTWEDVTLLLMNEIEKAYTNYRSGHES